MAKAKKSKPQLGDLARDKVTGFEGTITSITKFLTGCKQYGLTPLAMDNKVFSPECFDAPRLEILEKESVKTEDVSDKKEPGGPNRDAPKFKK